METSRKKQMRLGNPEILVRVQAVVEVIILFHRGIAEAGLAHRLGR